MLMLMLMVDVRLLHLSKALCHCGETRGPDFVPVFPCLHDRLSSRSYRVPTLIEVRSGDI